jgi:hypothetical protein
MKPAIMPVLGISVLDPISSLIRRGEKTSCFFLEKRISIHPNCMPISAIFQQEVIHVHDA